MRSIKTLLRHWFGKSLFIAASLLLLVFSQSASAGDVRFYFGGGHDYGYNYRTHPGFALGYGLGNHHHDGYYGRSYRNYYRHHLSPFVYYYGRQYGYPGYNRPFSYYHDNTRGFNYRRGYQEGYGDGFYNGRRHNRQRYRLGW